MKPALVACGLLVACGAGRAEVPNETPRQPCSLAEDAVTLRVPVPEGHALAAMQGACMLVDERSDAIFATIASLPTDAQGAELLQTDPATFFEEAGLLGDDARRTGRGQIELLGETVPTIRWAARPEGMPVRAITTAAKRQGALWIIVMIFSTPGDEEEREHMEALLAAFALEP